MAKTVSFNEFKEEVDIRDLYNYSLDDQEKRICDTAYNLHLQSYKTNAGIDGFVVLTHTGRTAKLLARYRPQIPIYAFCPTFRWRFSEIPRPCFLLLRLYLYRRKLLSYNGGHQISLLEYNFLFPSSISFLCPYQHLHTMNDIILPISVVETNI